MYTFTFTMFILMIFNLISNISALGASKFPIEVQRPHCVIKVLINMAIVIWAAVLLFG